MSWCADAVNPEHWLQMLSFELGAGKVCMQPVLRHANVANGKAASPDVCATMITGHITQHSGS